MPAYIPAELCVNLAMKVCGSLDPLSVSPSCSLFLQLLHDCSHHNCCLLMNPLITLSLPACRIFEHGWRVRVSHIAYIGYILAACTIDKPWM